MNRKQRVAIVLGLVLLALLGLFPPWTDSLTAPMGYHQELPSGYRFLFSPPRPFDDRHSITLDLKRLAVSWTVVLLLTGVIVVLLHSSSSAPVQQALSDVTPERRGGRQTFRLRVEVALLVVLLGVLISVGRRSLEEMQRYQWVIDREAGQAGQQALDQWWTEKARQDSLERKAALGRQRRAELERRRR